MIQTLEAHAATAGPASVLKLREVPTPSPGRNEVLIAVEAAGVAFGDIIAVTAQVSGETSASDWREALARLQECHSLLSASIEGKPGAVPWFRQVNTAPIPLRVVHGDPHSRWEAEVVEELAAPFDPRHAPLVRAVLIHATDNADHLFGRMRLRRPTDAGSLEKRVVHPGQGRRWRGSAWPKTRDLCPCGG
jgi:hypothetical protein